MLRPAPISLLALLIAGAPGACSSTDDPNVPKRILFMGNSLTLENDLPDLVRRMAMGAGAVEPVIDVRAFNSYALEDHWTDDSTHALLRIRRYDVLVMQQGPTTLPESSDNLMVWAKRWSDEAKQYHTRPGFYVIWPPLGGDIDAGIAHYTAAANANKAAIYPAAQAWRLAWQSDSTMPLYGPDHFHPSEHGSWLAALVITSMIFDLPVDALPNLFPGTITMAQEGVLRRAAVMAIGEFGKK